MTKQEFYQICTDSFAKNGLSAYATPKYLEKFYDLMVFMLEPNKKMNLTALRDEHSVISRHITDCLLAAKHLPETFPQGRGKLLDVGSGGGMPALPFAIIRPDIIITALDATAKKTAYILSAAEHLGLSNVKILTGRAEELGTDKAYRETFDIVCARAVAELRILMEWCVPFIKNGDIELANAQNAMKKLSCRLELDEICTLFEEENGDILTSERHNFIFKKMKPTDKLYPRRNAQITKNPL